MLVDCTLGCTEYTKSIDTDVKDNKSISVTDAQGGGTLSLRYFQFLLLHPAAPFENLGEDRSRLMASGRDVKFSQVISFLSDYIQNERLQIDELVPYCVQYVLRQMFVPRGLESGGSGYFLNLIHSNPRQKCSPWQTCR